MRETFHEGLCEISLKNGTFTLTVVGLMTIWPRRSWEFQMMLRLFPCCTYIWLVLTIQKGDRGHPSQVKVQEKMSQWCTLPWNRAFLMRNFTQSPMKKLPHATAQDCATTCPSSLLYLHPHKSKLLPVVMMQWGQIRWNFRQFLHNPCLSFVSDLADSYWLRFIQVGRVCRLRPKNSQGGPWIQQSKSKVKMQSITT